MEIPLQQEQGYSEGYNNVGPSDSFLKAMIEVEETIQKFEMETLRRKRLHVDLKTKTKKWIPMAQGVPQICNELGICEILGLIRGRATVIGRLTKKTDEEIMKDMFQFDRSLIELFSLRADDWDLDEELAKPLKECVLGLIQDIIFSSRGGFTAINLRSQYGRQENVHTTTAPEPNPGLLGLGGRG
jgi:hypothetical protein